MGVPRQLADPQVVVEKHVAAAWSISRANRTSLNVEGAFQHILTDLFGFIATAIGSARAKPVSMITRPASPSRGSRTGQHVLEGALDVQQGRSARASQRRRPDVDGDPDQRRDQHRPPVTAGRVTSGRPPARPAPGEREQRQAVAPARR